MKNLIKLFVLGAILISITGCSTTVAAQSGRGIPVVVMSEDSDPNSVKRSSDIFRRVITELQDQMQRYDYYVIDEEFIAGKLGWKVRDRRPKTELVEFVDLAIKSGDATLSPRAMVVIKIRAAGKKMGFGTKAQVRINGDIYDIDSNAYLGGWEAPTKEFPAPRECSGVCITEVVGNNARELATTLGDVLRKKLAYLARSDAGQRLSRGRDDKQLVNRYLIKFTHFSLTEVLSMTEVLETEFDCYVQARAPEGDSSVFKYNYETCQRPNDMFRGLNRMLLAAGYPEEQFKVMLRNRREFFIDKLYDAPPRPSKDVPHLK
jgi:hypothetical protein